MTPVLTDELIVPSEDERTFDLTSRELEPWYLPQDWTEEN